MVKLVIIFLGLKYALSLLSKEKNNNNYIPELIESYKLSFLLFYNVGIGLVDKLILGFLDIRLLAIYSIGVLIPLKIKDQVKLVLSIIVQRWAKNGEISYIENINKYIYIIVGFNIFLSFSLAFFSQLYIPIIFSEEYLKSIYVIWIISFSIPFIMSEYIYQTYIVVFHNTEIYRKIIYTKHILYLTSLVVLLPLYSIEGVAFAFFLRNFYSFMLNYIYYNKYKKRVM
jgi:O-antigen/teichoic acid export membrane protein